MVTRNCIIQVSLIKINCNQPDLGLLFKLDLLNQATCFNKARYLDRCTHVRIHDEHLQKNYPKIYN